MLDFFILAGELSGDTLGAELIQKLPPCKILAVAGPQMRKTSTEVLFEMERLETMGFIDVLRCLPHLYKQLRLVKKTILKRNPKAVILIDYSDFNLFLGKALRKSGYEGKIIQYVCPSVWAWRKGRIKTLEKNFDLLLSILPFEKKHFSDSFLQVEYVGHPLAKLHPTPSEKKYLSLFPGSRQTEIERNLPLHLSVAEELSTYPIALSLSDEKFRPLITKLAPVAKIIPKEKRYELMQQSHAAIATSGTINLELALHSVPTVVTFAIKPLDLIIAKDLLRIRLPHYALPNIIAERRVFPELYGPNFTKENLKQELNKVLNDPTPIQSGCAQIQKLLKEQKNCDLASILLKCLHG